MSSKFQVSTDAIEAASIDGKCLMKMLDTNDELLTTRVEKEGLGFSQLQLRNVKSEIEASDLR